MSETIVRRKLSLLQVSRAVAPMLILLFHAGLFKLFNLNLVYYSGGVDFFFVLSGFMMFYIFGTYIGDKDKAISFIINRIIRIYPIYWIITVIFILIYTLIPSVNPSFKMQFIYILKSLFLFPQHEVPVINVAWSLVYTMLCYGIFFILMLMQRRVALWLGAIWILLCVIVAITDIQGTFFFSENVLKFASGSVVAFVMQNWNIRYGKLMIMVGVILFPASWVVLQYLYHPIWVLSIGYISGSIMIVMGCASIDLKKDVKIPSFLNYIGNASYSILLSHIIIIQAFNTIFSYVKMHELISVAVSIVIGCLIHSKIEKPVHMRLKQYVSRQMNDSIKQKRHEKLINYKIGFNQRIKSVYPVLYKKYTGQK